MIRVTTLSMRSAALAYRLHNLLAFDFKAQHTVQFGEGKGKIVSLKKKKKPLAWKLERICNDLLAKCDLGSVKLCFLFSVKPYYVKLIVTAYGVT